MYTMTANGARQHPNGTQRLPYAPLKVWRLRPSQRRFIYRTTVIRRRTPLTCETGRFLDDMLRVDPILVHARRSGTLTIPDVCRAFKRHRMKVHGLPNA